MSCTINVTFRWFICIPCSTRTEFMCKLVEMNVKNTCKFSSAIMFFFISKADFGPKECAYSFETYIIMSCISFPSMRWFVCSPS